ncbi:hypothetical protein [Streptomyces sp. NPDC088762]|uniref:hypothetical protein n=1 Tax=Streptomyces sp. NPDC088762 TaxID=3365891 RepID=UPI0038285EB4
MSRSERWSAFSGFLAMGVWGALGWILFDPDLQGIRDSLGWWMLAIAAVPLVIGGVIVTVFDEGDGGGSWADEDEEVGPRGLRGCGGCGG